MNIFTQILETAAKELGFPFKVVKSDKSEAAYLTIACYSNSDLNEVYSCLGVRLAAHDAMTAKSKAYEIQLDCGFNFDYSNKSFSTTWGVDEDGDFSENALEDELFFKTDDEAAVYMANALVTYLRYKAA